jgi:phospholipase C
MAHQCIISISNINNKYPLTLQSITSQGAFSNIIPAATAIAAGAIVPAGGTLSFVLTGGDIESASATMIWLTGATENLTEAVISMTFQNDLAFDNNVTLNVACAQQYSSNALMAYGVSYFYASQGNGNQMTRDFIHTDGILSRSPVYANYSVVYNSFATEAPAAPFLPGITNVVMLMLENRGFDHLMGMLYTNDPAHVYPAGSTVPPGHSTIQNPINFDGLFNNPGFSNSIPGGSTVTISAVAGTLDIPNPDPGEGWVNTNVQVFNTTAYPPPGAANMQGFLADYVGQGTSDEPTPDPDQIMQYYTSSDLPVISTLATSYAVSDAWHASVPSQTTPNRAFSLSGTSEGYVDNSKDGKDIDIFNVLTDMVTYGSNTIFNVLSNCGLENKWAIYYQDDLFSDCFTTYLFSQVSKYEGTGHVKPLSSGDSSTSTFLTDIANNTLPAFSYLEPAWYLTQHGVNGNDYHPPANLCDGEQDLAMIYKALTGYVNWDTTLFIVTFDEHGGTFDHVVPPATIAPDGLKDWSDFGFNRLGIRIPTLLISPMIEGGTVFRSPTEAPFDHTSFLKTILGWQNIDVSGGVLGARAAQAPNFSGVLSSTAVNKNPVSLTPPQCPSGNLYGQPLNDLQKLILPFLAQNLSGGEFGSDEHKSVYRDIEGIKSVGDLKDYVKTSRAKK